MKSLFALYRAALRLYPASFRNDFASEMAQDFADGCRDARAARRLPVYLCHIAADTLGSLFHEWRTIMRRKTGYDVPCRYRGKRRICLL